MSSVTFPTAIGGDGSTVTDDDNATTGLRNGGWRTRFIPCFTNLVNIADYIVSYTAQTSTFAEPPPMGSTTPNTGAFTRVTVTGSTAPVNGMYLPGTNSLGFAVNSTEAVRINSSGNVGIGTSSPGYKLDLTASNDGRARQWISAVGFSSSADGTKGFQLRNLGSGVDGIKFSNYANNVTWATIDTSGNLGLGVTPSAWGTASKALELPSGAALSSLSGYSLVYNNAYHNGTSYTYKANGFASIYQTGSGTHLWLTAPSGTAGNAISFTQAMTLDASGNLLVGCATTPSSTVSGTQISRSLPIYTSVGSYTGAADMITFINGNGTVGYIRTNASATTYSTSSDQRLKTNVKPAGSAIQSILNFPVDQFDWISTGEHQDFGAVAQKAINFIPEMVQASEDPNEMWGIDWSKANPRLIKAFQEMYAELQELKQRIH